MIDEFVALIKLKDQKEELEKKSTENVRRRAAAIQADYLRNEIRKHGVEPCA